MSSAIKILWKYFLFVVPLYIYLYSKCFLGLAFFQDQLVLASKGNLCRYLTSSKNGIIKNRENPANAPALLLYAQWNLALMNCQIVNCLALVNIFYPHKQFFSINLHLDSVNLAFFSCFLKSSLNPGSTVYAWLCVGGVNNSNDQTKLTEAIFKMHSTVTAAQLIISMISVQKKTL